MTLNDATDATARNMRRFVGPERIDDARRAQQIRTLAELKGTSNNPWISILNDTIRHLCVEDLRNSLLLRATFALI